MSFQRPFQDIDIDRILVDDESAKSA